MSHHVHKIAAFSLPMEDRIGALLKVATDLNNHGVDLQDISAWVEDEGQARAVFIPTDPALVSACGCETCCAAQPVNLLWVEMEDRPGIIAEHLAQLAEAGLNIKSVHATAWGGKGVAIYHFADEATLDAAAAALGECCTG
jgi:hypothetical protein